MQVFIFFLLALFSTLYGSEKASDPDKPGALIFTPPKDWAAADPSVLPKSVKMMVVGKGKKEYPPSINLGIEPFKGSLREYLKVVKAVNESQGSDWKDLGMVVTDAGKASLSQVDMRTNWGDVRLMHVILIKNGNAYILTAGALKEEFPVFYKEFFQAMTSIYFNKDVFERVEPKRKRNRLKRAFDKVAKHYAEIAKEKSGSQFEERFKDETFQNGSWLPFVRMVETDYADQGEPWKKDFFEEVKSQLIAQTSEN